MPGRTGRFRRSDRLRASRDFRRVSRKGRRVASREFVLLTAGSRNTRSESRASWRLGITASRKVGNAVMRNRVKRAVREWFRGFRGEIAGSGDLVVIARRPAASLSGQELEARLSQLVRRAAPMGEKR